MTPVNGAPASEEPRLTSGEFGTEFKSFTDERKLPLQLVTLLRTSATFMRMARELDRHYVAFHTAPKSWQSKWKPSGDGVLTSGPFLGRRVLAISGLASETGNRFVQPGLPENFTSACPTCDFIFIDAGFGGDTIKIAEITESVAHETTHAFNRVARPIKLPSNATRAERITAAIDEELETRKQTNEILSEIKSASKGKIDFVRASTERWAVERAFFPGMHRRTYLEHFVFSDLIREQVEFQKADEKAIEAWNRQVDGLRLGKPLDVFLNTEFPVDHTVDPESRIVPGAVGAYFELRLVLRVISARWNETLKLEFSDDSAFEKAKEKVLQDHARAFFPRKPEEIRYTPRP